MTRRELLDAFLKTDPSPFLIGNLEHSFIGYDRFFEAGIIYGNLKGSRHVLDFGCGAGDYGSYFLERGWTVDFYDYREVIEFVRFRLKAENRTGGTYTVELGWQKLPLETYDLVVFGEVLEHLENPLEILETCYIRRVPHLVTTSYPYKTREEYGTKGHLIEAYEQQRACRDLLLGRYRKTNFGGELNLWTRL